MRFTDSLNDKQREAAETTEGPLLILAGAGSGKTRTIIARIAHILEDELAWPSQILAITFTNKAANEMIERLESIEGIETRGIWMSTFHVACAKILRMYAERLGYSKNFRVIDTYDQRMLVKNVIKQLDYSEKNFAPAKVLNRISKLKNDRIGPEQVTAYLESYDAQIIADIYSGYESAKQQADALDFDDLILKAVELLEDNPDVLGYFQNKFKYILVDEFQDSATRFRLKISNIQ